MQGPLSPQSTIHGLSMPHLESIVPTTVDFDLDLPPLNFDEQIIINSGVPHSLPIAIPVEDGPLTPGGWPSLQLHLMFIIYIIFKVLVSEYIILLRVYNYYNVIL